ncbi:hypothetical protein F5B22DRAFT_594912 [Xylaria bambusicola]|uniref:uncharacterized protein n=1 Tax=Xylaria bambusicola TaxID=326684 RepID=UPI00200851A9|nr:uncharacterized protein F5B22DRAFT_594912 [Xylaria bambusicola]KAI0521980.1 hypothetical protein F5B22DRAFT_594912 [Xylaria bambusicola]
MSLTPQITITTAKMLRDLEHPSMPQQFLLVILMCLSAKVLRRTHDRDFSGQAGIVGIIISTWALSVLLFCMASLLRHYVIV